ncbi:MAG: alpha/beta fold hydrolase [SAR202 cluster bacterium]|nr:alpha/beta fold hydrolase [SAR202 cluster bacterium]
MTTTAQFTERGTSKTVQAMGTTIHYHEVGQGDPIVFLHSYGPGTTAWITWHKILPEFSKHFRCIAMDLPNFAKTGPVIYEEPVHNLQAKTALALMDALNIKKAHIVGNSQGGQTSMSFAYHYPDRINKLVWGAGHIGTSGGYPNEYLISNKSEEGIRASREAAENPTVENFRRYLRLHIVDESLITDDLVNYLIKMHTGRKDLADARAKSKSTPYDHSRDMMNVKAPTLVVWGRNDRTCTFEIGINALNLMPKSRLIVLRDTGHWVPFERPAEYTAHVLNFLKGDWAQ